MPVLALLHTPPVVALERDVVAPAHTEAVPVIVPADGSALTATDCVVVAAPQPPVTAYDIVALPATTPVTTPEADTEAMLVLELLHTPPVVAFERDVAAPAHTEAVPVIVPADGRALTATDCVVVAVPQPFVTA
jgi:hypothetical protein